MPPRRFRKIVRSLRLKGFPIGSAAGHPNGYWVPETAAELRAFFEGARKHARKMYAVARAQERSGWLALAEGQLEIKGKK